MAKIFVNLFWGIVALIFLLIGLATPNFLIISIVLSLLIFFWRIILHLKSRIIINKEIPQDILNDFQEAEKRYIDSNGQTEPHEILWQIARSKQRGIQQNIPNNLRVTDRNVLTEDIKYKKRPNRLAYKNIFNKKKEVRNGKI